MLNEGWNTCSYLILKKTAFRKLTLFKYPKAKITMQLVCKFLNKSYVCDSYKNVLKIHILVQMRDILPVVNLNDVAAW